jgi:hypothetical protein
MSMPLAGVLLLHHGAYQIKDEYLYLVGVRTTDYTEYGVWVLSCPEEEVPVDLSQTYVDRALFSQFFGEDTLYPFLIEKFSVSTKVDWDALSFNPMTLYLDGKP